MIRDGQHLRAVAPALSSSPADMAIATHYIIDGPSPNDGSLSSQPSKKLSPKRDARHDSLRMLYRTSASPPTIESIASKNDVHDAAPTTPLLPPTPPSADDDHDTAVNPGLMSEKDNRRSSIVTPVNQQTPPTPDNTPPRRKHLQATRPFLGAQPSMTSSRAESFKTAQEEFSSEDEDEPRLAARTSFLKTISPSPLNARERLRSSSANTYVSAGSGKGRPKRSASSPISSAAESVAQPPEVIATPEGQPTFNVYAAVTRDASFPMQNLPTTEPKVDNPVNKHPHQNPLSSTHQTRPKGVTELPSVRRGPSLRERLETTHDTPSASTENFAHIIGWNNIVSRDALKEARRWSGISTTSTVGAMVYDQPQTLPKRRTTLRHISKRGSLRAASSPLPVSNRASLQFNSESLHKLVHKKARLSNQNRWSFSSEVSRPFSVASSTALPTIEVIHVAVIPERTSSLGSSTTRGKSDSGATQSSGSSCARRFPGTDAIQHTRKSSASPDRGRRRTYPPVVPQRGSSLSAPTSRGNSRANSITSDHLRVQRQKAEKELRRTLDRMESDRLISSLKKLQASGHDISYEESEQVTPSKQVKEPEIHRVKRNVAPTSPEMSNIAVKPVSIKHVEPGTQEWAALRPPSILVTPFSQQSVLSTSPPIEMGEARTINYFPHNNHSLQIIEPNVSLQSRAVLELRRQNGLSTVSSASSEVQSPLQNPRQPPEPPLFTVMPSTPGDELDQQLGHDEASTTVRRFESMRRPALAARETSKSFVDSLSRGFSLKNARNKKADQELDSSLHPFWRPKGFWDDIDDERHERSRYRDVEQRGVVNNSLGISQQQVVFAGPITLIRRISERRRSKRGIAKQSSYSSLGKLRAGRKLYRVPGLGIRAHFAGIHGLPDRVLNARRRKEDEKREKRREELRKSIGPNVVPQGDSRFPPAEQALQGMLEPSIVMR